MFGVDVWAEGLTEDYLNECRESPKYKRGTWHVLLEDDQLVSSLIIYNLDENQFGIGSIATPKSLRKKGYASRIIKDIIQKIEIKYPDAILFLYSDINTEFYEKFNFQKLPVSSQRYKSTNIVGALDIKSNNLQAGEIGYWVHQNHSGLASNAISILKDFAKQAGYQILFAQTKKSNEKSNQALLRNLFEINENYKNDTSCEKAFSIKL